MAASDTIVVGELSASSDEEGEEKDITQKWK